MYMLKVSTKDNCMKLYVKLQCKISLYYNQDVTHECIAPVLARNESLHFSFSKQLNNFTN